ncbi:VOC family protein [Exiguobacterium indicum]|uniref:VOC family protein n=2 Tax=Exiguobacterium indicum TaxID=296995 RepID=A0ABU8ED64_9BACL|nr:VOC family protein [Exiguobacterium sp. JMULE1]NTY09468.1 VOC family protein [Exiguobacterium sp. JMULE1]
MPIKRTDHISLNVVNLEEAIHFFSLCGLEVRGRWEMKGELLDRLLSLEGAETECVALGLPGEPLWLELVRFKHPLDTASVIQSVHAGGLRHLCFEVTALTALVERLADNGYQSIGDIANYENEYRLCYVRGPEDVIIELAEKIGPV